MKTVRLLMKPSPARTLLILLLSVIGLFVACPSAAQTTGDNGLPAEIRSQIDSADSGTADNSAAVSGQSKSHHSKLDQRIDELESNLLQFKATAEDTRALFDEYRDALRIRLWQFEQALDNADTSTAPINDNSELLEKQHPGFPAAAYALPAGIETLDELYRNLQAHFDARNRLLGLAEQELLGEVVGTGLYGMQELRSEIDMAVLEFRYQLLRLPDTIVGVGGMRTWAPVPLLWIVLKIWIAITLFRWWRRWVPGTIQRIRSALLAIRPRTETVMSRLRLVWYVNQVRAPLEWLLLLSFLLGQIQFSGIGLLHDLLTIIVRWCLLAWFAVELLNAIADRGSASSGDLARLRLQSMRLVAAWLVMLGLGNALVMRMVGDGALLSWVWRAFQILAFPLAFRLLGIWHMELFRRLERAGEPEISEQDYAAQRGLRKWIGSAKIIGILLAGWLRGILMRRIDEIGSGTVSSEALAATGYSPVARDHRLPTDIREQLIEDQDKGQIGKYARQERKTLVERINLNTGGTIAVIGERGIGKRSFLTLVAEEHEHNTIELDCKTGDFDSLMADFFDQLGLEQQNATQEIVDARLEEKNISLIIIHDIHLLVRPVPGGFKVIERLIELQGLVLRPVIWAVSIDRYAYQLISRARAEQALVSTLVQLPAWTEEQIGELLENRCTAAKLKPDFSKIRIPRQYMDTAQEDIEERNRAGTYSMITAMSRGNPSIALRLFADLISLNEEGTAEFMLPGNPDAEIVENSSTHVLLVLRVIAQLEQIRFDDIVTNLRFEPTHVRSVIHFAMINNWVEEQDGRYRISWPWFRTITRILARRNLLAGVRSESR